MKIDPIKNGIVIDHIEAGKGMEVYNFLSLGELNCTVALIKNVPSKKTGKKDIIKSLLLLKNTDIKNVPGFYFYKTNKLKIRFKRRPEKNWCIDGEELDSAVLDYEIDIVKDLKMLIPKKAIKKIFVNDVK